MPGEARTIADLLKQAAVAAWSRDRLVDEIVRGHRVSPLRAHRLAACKTLTQTAHELRAIHREQFGTDAALSHHNVSKWETGRDSPSARYRDLLCRLYATRPDKLGLGADYSHPEANLLNGQATVNRRGMIQAAGFVMTQGLLADLDSARSRTEDLMQKIQATPINLASLRNQVREFGYDIRFADPHTFLRGARYTFSKLQAMWEERQTLQTQRRLGLEMAKLGGLIAIDLNAIGDPIAADEWFRLAGSLAQEAGDDQLQAWVVAYEAMSHLWHGRRPGRALELAKKAGYLAGDLPSAGSALAALMEARAWARLGRPAEARRALGAAESSWSALGADVGQEETAFGCYEQLLRMYQSDVLTINGDFNAAKDAQERAFALAPRTRALDVDTALVQFDRTSCLVRQGAIDSAAALASNTYRQVPEGFRQGAVSQRARQIVDMAIQRGAKKLVAELEELLRAH